MSKSKRTSKAKRNQRRVVVNDPSLPLLRGIEWVTPPVKALSPARQRAWNREKALLDAADRERAKVSAAAHAARLERRPQAMQGRYKLPSDVHRFFARLFGEWELYHGPVGQQGETPMPVDAVSELIEAAYMEGCRQGYIEGRVADLEPKRQRSRKANAAKRQKRQDCGGQMMTLDERDAAIVSEYPTLRKMLGSIEAQLRLAEKYGLTSREQVGNVIRKAKRNGTA